MIGKAFKVLRLVAVLFMALVTVVTAIAALALWRSGALAPEKIERYGMVARGEEPPVPTIESYAAELRAEAQAYRDARESMERRRQAMDAWQDALASQQEQLDRQLMVLAQDRQALEESRQEWIATVMATTDAETAARLDLVVRSIAGIQDPQTAVQILWTYTEEDIVNVIRAATPGRRRALIEAMERIGQEAEAAGGNATTEQQGWNQKFTRILLMLLQGESSGVTSGDGSTSRG